MTNFHNMKPNLGEDSHGKMQNMAENKDFLAEFR